MYSVWVNMNILHLYEYYVLYLHYAQKQNNTNINKIEYELHTFK